MFLPPSGLGKGGRLCGGQGCIRECLYWNFRGGKGDLVWWVRRRLRPLVIERYCVRENRLDVRISFPLELSPHLPPQSSLWTILETCITQC